MRRWRRERAVVRAGCLAHNVLWFRRDAIEAALNAGEWEAAERHAAALEDYTRAEPLPWSDFIVARGRALATHGRGKGGAGLTAELVRLRDEAERVGLRSALPALGKRCWAARHEADRLLLAHHAGSPPTWLVWRATIHVDVLPR